MSLFRAPKFVANLLESFRNSFFLGVDLEKHQMTWVRWKKAFAHNQYGGRGVNSMFALNRALLFKWVWQFLSFPNVLWVKVIEAIHGNHGLIGKTLPRHIVNYVWICIIKIVDSLRSKGIDLLSFCKRVVGNSQFTSFWEDN